MKKTILAAWGLCLVFAVGVDAAIAVGGKQPASPRLDALHLTDCSLPCWIGIVPGKTTISEARKQIVKTFAQSSNYSATSMADRPDSMLIYILKNNENGAQFPIVLQAPDDIGDQSIITQIDFQFERVPPAQADNLPSLGEIQSLIGYPGRVIVIPASFGETMQYGNNLQGILLYGNTGSLLNRAEELTIFSGNQLGYIDDPKFYPWLGFSPSGSRYPNECNTSGLASICNP